MRRRATAFSLIELLTVIAIIGILTTLLIVGIDKMGRSIKTRATVADLTNAQAFLGEMKAHGAMETSQPVNWLWRNLGSSTTPPIVTGGTPTPNFWKVPDTYVVGAVTYKDSLDAQPGTLADTSGNGDETFRNGSRDVLNTQLAMRILLSYADNKAAIAKMPADRLFVPNWVHGAFAADDVTGPDGISNTGDETNDKATAVAYAVNNCVRDYDPTAKGWGTYRCINSNLAATATEPYTDTADWVADNDPTPLLLDAWGNPLIFVPATGLINVRTGSASSGDLTIVALPGSGAITGYNRTIAAPIQSPDNQPYFASAGPDGDLSTGDDNVYSFSK